MAAFLFPTVIDVPLTIADDNTTLSGLTLAKTTLLLVTLTTSVTLLGLSVVGGNVDGMVVAVQKVTSSFSLSISHEALAATGANRFRNASAAPAGYNAVWYRYDGALSRWLHLAST